MGLKRAIKKSLGNYDILLKEAFDEFIQEKEINGLSAATITSYQDSYRRFCMYFDYDERNTTVRDIDRDMVYRWITLMITDGMKHTTINHYLRDMRAFLYWCMKPERAYLEEYKINNVKGQEEQIKVFSDEEIDILLEKPPRTAEFVEWRTFVIVNWVLATGNRASTICDVKISDIDFRSKEIILHHTKNKKAQTVPLSSALERTINEYIRMFRKDADDDDYLFANVANEKLTNNALRQAFSKYCKDRGVERTSIHGLRHSFAKIWVRNGGNMFVLQNILGHSTLDMTRKYVKLFNEDIKEDYDIFSPLDTIKKSAKRTQTIKRSEELPTKLVRQPRGGKR